MKALVLAGGKGTRLRPVTYSLAKQLVPVANRPILHYVVENLIAAGIAQIGVVISPETGEMIRKSLEEGHFDATFTFILQEEPKGLAHAVKTARSFLGGDPFVMYLGDNLIGSGIRELVERFLQGGDEALILLKEVENPRMFGVVVTDQEGNARRLVEKPSVPPSNLALVGVYLFGRRIFDAIESLAPSARGEYEITDAIQTLVDWGLPVRTARLETWWLDTGKKDDLLEANRVVLDEWAKPDVRGTVLDSSIVGRVRIGEGALVERSVVRGPAVIGEGAVVRNARIGPFTSIGRGCCIEDSTVDYSVIMDHARISGVECLDASLVGCRSRIVRRLRRDRSMSLCVGDDAEIEV